jgi:uroporphyrin-III C-methyltransferase/precorrin-2 dehydrogenase/sirohydrochlorin ferrochelatase
MGLIGIHQVCEQLILHGLPKDTPAALIQKGTTAEHHVIISDLGALPETVTHEKPKPPTLIIIGSVVSLHKKLNWF